MEGLLKRPGSNSRLHQPLHKQGLCLLSVLALSAVLGGQGQETMGVCWGRISYQPLPPKVVVKMLQDNKISRVKLFDADPDSLRALVGTDIETMVMVGNQHLAQMAVSPPQAEAWVDYNVKRYLFPGGVNIKYVAVGNEPFLTSNNGRFNNVLVPAVQNVYNALKTLGIDDKVLITVPFNADILDVSYPPSKATFRSEISLQIQQIATLLSSTGAPFSINIYPYLNLYYKSGDFSMDQIFVSRDGGSGTFTDPGTGLVYTNVFDSSYDAVLTALDSVGAGKLEVILGEIGWPTDGEGVSNPYATIDNAKEFNNAIIKHMINGKGTPLRPGKPFWGYLFGLLDENAKSTDPGTFERSWGIFRANGGVKYELDLSGGISPQALVPAKGVEFFPKKWCVAKADANTDALATALEYACSEGNKVDCTPISEGSTCYFNNDLVQIASYAFNSYYQIQNQSSAACSFGGTAEVVNIDPSSNNCAYPLGIQLVSSSSTTRPSQLLIVMVIVWTLILLHQVP